MRKRKRAEGEREKSSTARRGGATNRKCPTEGTLRTAHSKAATARAEVTADAGEAVGGRGKKTKGRERLNDK